MNLCLVKELGDRAAQGRAYGNLGNTHYLLGNFLEAIKFHRQVNISQNLQEKQLSLIPMQIIFHLFFFIAIIHSQRIWG